ncbi:MAG: hypothetical protein KA112_00850 [Alphaproteobacteria bacterium]|nr:hypothetical protein [Alphaproteobacteria bacterium]MBP7729150.1 hypothetical protein [Alphaproteobacteria bacterium]
MLQKLLTHKTGSLSKILMGTAMIGFFGIFSPNTAAAKGEECYQLDHQQHECESNDACSWSQWLPSCVGDKHCMDLDDTTCNQTAGCSLSNPSPDMGSCYPKHL